MRLWLPLASAVLNKVVGSDLHLAPPVTVLRLL